MIISDKIVSVSELRKHFSRYLQKAKKLKEPLFVFSNNKPIGVFRDIASYEESIHHAHKVDLVKISLSDLSKESVDAYKEAQNTPLDQLIDL